jgi:hypothetical protein
VFVEAGLEVFGGHFAGLPLEAVQVQHGAQGRVHLVGADEAVFHAELAELADLGLDASGPAGRHPGEQLVHRVGGQLQAHRVGQLSPGAGPACVHLLRGAARADLADVDQCGAGGRPEGLGECVRGPVGVFVVEQYVPVVGDRSAERDQSGQWDAGAHQRCGGP